MRPIDSSKELDQQEITESSLEDSQNISEESNFINNALVTIGLFAAPYIIRTAFMAYNGEADCDIEDIEGPEL